MPGAVILFGAIYYWALGGFVLSRSVLSDRFRDPRYPHPMVFYALVLLFLIGESMNGACHLVLMKLRPAGTSAKGVPKVSDAHRDEHIIGIRVRIREQRELHVGDGDLGRVHVSVPDSCLYFR